MIPSKIVLLCLVGFLLLADFIEARPAPDDDHGRGDVKAGGQGGLNIASGGLNAGGKAGLNVGDDASGGGLSAGGMNGLKLGGPISALDLNKLGLSSLDISHLIDGDVSLSKLDESALDLSTLETSDTDLSKLHQRNGKLGDLHIGGPVNGPRASGPGGHHPKSKSPHGGKPTTPGSDSSDSDGSQMLAAPTPSQAPDSDSSSEKKDDHPDHHHVHHGKPHHHHYRKKGETHHHHTGGKPHVQHHKIEGNSGDSSGDDSGAPAAQAAPTEIPDVTPDSGDSNGGDSSGDDSGAPVAPTENHHGLDGFSPETILLFKKILGNLNIDLSQIDLPTLLGLGGEGGRHGNHLYEDNIHKYDGKDSLRPNRLQPSVCADSVNDRYGVGKHFVRGARDVGNAIFSEAEYILDPLFNGLTLGLGQGLKALLCAIENGFSDFGSDFDSATDIAKHGLVNFFKLQGPHPVLGIPVGIAGIAGEAVKAAGSIAGDAATGIRSGLGQLLNQLG